MCFNLRDEFAKSRIIKLANFHVNLLFERVVLALDRTKNDNVL